MMYDRPTVITNTSSAEINKYLDYLDPADREVPDLF